MSGLTLFAFAVSGFALAWLMTAAVRRYALASSLLDLPNERSSHTVPTPRGGGLAFVAAFLLLCVVYGVLGNGPPGLTRAIVGAGLLVAALGWVDDRRPLPAGLRLAGHALAAGWVLWCLNPLPPVPLLGVSVDLGIAASLLVLLFLVWMVNLFNFMDGIDGIASVEAITVALGGALLWWIGGSGSEWTLALVFAACVAGFMLWNLPPAKIFMGDAGSGFLGLVIGIMAVWSAQVAAHLFWSWFILVGCFMVDATTTLVRRVRRGERVSQAHRTHAYQHAARKLGRHLPVTLAYGAVTLVWLLPIAVAVALKRLDGVAGVALAYAPLVWLAYRLRAGKLEAPA